MNYGHRACFICGQQVDSNSNNAIMLVTAWVKANGKTVFRTERHEYKFAHIYCMETNRSIDQMELF